MKKLTNFFLITGLQVAVHSNAQFLPAEYFYLGKQSGTPKLYRFKPNNEVVPASVFSKPDVWNLLTGRQDGTDTASLQTIAPHFFQQANTGTWVYISKSSGSDYSRVCPVGDSLLITDFKGKNLWLASRTGDKLNYYEKRMEFEQLQDVRKEEQKAQRKFLITYSPIKQKFFFLRNGSLCSMALSPNAPIEEIVKPVGGLQLVEFSLSPSADHAVLLFVPSVVKWTQWSTSYSNQSKQLFNLQTGRPVTGIPLRMKESNDVSWTYSADGKRLLTWSVNGGSHTGSYYDLEKEEKIREYGPVIYKLAGNYWIPLIDDRYLCVLAWKPSTYKGLRAVKVYDLLDSLRPVKSFYIDPAAPSGYNELAAQPNPVKLKGATTASQLVKTLPILPLPLKIETFMRPLPGNPVPPHLWRTFGFSFPTMTDGTERNPTARDSAGGHFRLYAVGALSATAKGKILLFASIFFPRLHSNDFAETEFYTVVRYWAVAYDEEKQETVGNYLVVDDERNYLDHHHSYMLPVTYIRKAFNDENKIEFSNAGINIPVLDINTLSPVKK